MFKFLNKYSILNNFYFIKKDFFHIKKLPMLLILFFPYALIIDPFFSDLVVSLLAVLYLYISWKNKLLYEFKSPIVIYIIIFWLYCLTRSLFSIDPLLSLESSLFYCRFLLFAMCIKHYLEKFPALYFYIAISLWSAMIIVVFDALYQNFFDYNLLGWRRQDHLRISGLFDDEYAIGSYLSRLFPLGFFFIASRKKINMWIAYLSLFFIMIVDILIYLSGERTAFFYLFLVTLLIIFLTRRIRFIRTITFALSIIVIIILSNIQPTSKVRMIDTTISQIGLDKGSSKINVFSIEHERIFVSAIKMFFDNPIFGQGPKIFRILCKKIEYDTGGCSTHPHNTYIQLLSETGIVGASMIVILLIIIIYIFIKQFISLYIKKSYFYIDDSKICLLICFFITLWPFIPTGNFFNNWINGIYYFPLGFYLAKK